MGSDNRHHEHHGAGRISIHAPRMGSDPMSAGISLCGIYFNPRSPQGERLIPSRTRTGIEIFQSTLPAGGATRSVRRQPQDRGISIHAPRRGSDTINSLRQAFQVQFQSTLPAGGATPAPIKAPPNFEFQSTLPAGGATSSRIARLLVYCISIHAPRRGSD